VPDWIAEETGTYWLHVTFFEAGQHRQLVDVD
jgi:hypothetical protein